MNSSSLYKLSAQTSLPICCGLHPRFHRRAITHIHRPHGRRGALLREGRPRGADRRGIPRTEIHMTAFGSEGLGDRPADALGAARDGARLLPELMVIS